MDRGAKTPRWGEGARGRPTAIMRLTSVDCREGAAQHKGDKGAQGAHGREERQRMREGVGRAGEG